MLKHNCWDYNNCGRGPGGIRVTQSGQCPASTTSSCTGLNNGQNGGRMCWAIAGTFSRGRVMGEFASELSCLNCNFLKFVCEEEGICKAESLTPHQLFHNRSRMFGRRKYMRIDVHFDMTLQPPKSRSDVRGVTIDFSCEGFSFVSSNIDLQPDDPIEFQIINSDTNEFAYVLANVAWKQQIRDRCIAGVKISFVEQEIKSRILDYTYNKWIKGVQFH